MAGLQALSLDRVSKQYGAARALDDVSLTVAGGEFLTLLGPSGSGKTTLLMSIAGFVAPTSGHIRLNGQPIEHLPPEKRNFGMVFQGYALFPHLTVARNVAFPLEVRGTPRAEIEKKVKEALGLVQLGAFAERLPRQLSGGQQQRVALARALVFAPHLMLLDEPLSALDRKLRADMQIELKSFHRQIGLTFIYVTHDQDEALSMSDRVAILREGKLLQLGPPSELYERPATRFVAEFLGKSNFLSGRVERRSADGFTFRCNGLSFEHKGIDAPAIDSEVLMALRPERMRVVEGDDRPRNTIEGSIAEFSYLGTAFHLLVDTVAGRLAVTVPTWRHGGPPAIGSRLTVGWDADASIRVEHD
ncbi:putative spermidine/putrescine transport system ATP-binding protein [Enhydrobacter aerosaccus]|uniref:Spermidine/putrescine import ATP-binding protein PotA n=1 Tax=Enhydrobacter aerosaccus TaxID=225324 RepID=A0A1T4SR66_9HYPH|nr:ABC transporter ATP-binding protein [Enhydrobacter aerosaccus]SKA30672.1 putative spermidine/putrescine transport system ATP-binding protein [Enhydrobacter aerosaccus]